MKPAAQMTPAEEASARRQPYTVDASTSAIVNLQELVRLLGAASNSTRTADEPSRRNQSLAQSKVVSINLPRWIADSLKDNAKRHGISMSAYATGMLARSGQGETLEDVRVANAVSKLTRELSRLQEMLSDSVARLNTVLGQLRPPLQRETGGTDQGAPTNAAQIDSGENSNKTQAESTGS